MSRIQKILAIAAMTVSCINANELNTEIQSKDTIKEITGDITLDEVKKMEQDLAKREQELLQEQIAINEKWRQFRQDEAEEAKKAKKAEQHAFKTELDQLKLAQKENWEKLSIKQQLADLIDSFGVNGQGTEIWGSELESAPQNITLHIDTEKNSIGVFSDDLDTKGRPVIQWEMDKNTGHITETKRAKDGSEVHVTEKDIDVNTLTQDPIPQLEEQIEKVKETEAGVVVEEKRSKTFDEEYDLEAQRDLAFKIMYCLIVFIIITFGLLYVFFKMTQIQEDQQTGGVRKGVAKGQRVSDQQDTFIDFLAGRMDYENYVVNPNQAKAVSFTPGTPIASHQYVKAQRLSNSHANKASNEHRNNTGFGANNLEHLSNAERGRFDDIHFDNENIKTDFALLANFSTQNP